MVLFLVLTKLVREGLKNVTKKMFFSVHRKNRFLKIIFKNDSEWSKTHEDKINFNKIKILTFQNILYPVLLKKPLWLRKGC